MKIREVQEGKNMEERMTKWLAVFLAVLMLLTVTACGGDEDISGGENSDDVSEVGSITTTTIASSDEEVTTATTTASSDKATTTTTMTASSDKVTATTTVKKIQTTQKTTTTTAKKEGIELQFLRVERLHPSITVGGKDIWERLAPLNGHCLLTQIGDKIVYRIINHEKDSGWYIGTFGALNCKVEISGDIATVTVATDGNHAAPLANPKFWIYDQSGALVGPPDMDVPLCIHFLYTINPVSDNDMVAYMLSYYASYRMYRPYGELTGSSVVEKTIPVTTGTEWIETAIETLDDFVDKGYAYYKLSLWDNVLTIRVANEHL
jgi:hypothetical protein